MANFTYCELCGRVIDSDEKIATLEFAGEKLDYHAPWCARKVLRLLEDASRWALGDVGATGLVWKLEEADRHPTRKQSAVLEARYRNRILALCRERGINRDDLAEQIGTSRGAVGRWLLSYTTEKPSRRDATRHCYAHGITERWQKRLVMFFDLGCNRDLFETEPSGDAPDSEFVETA